MNRQQAIIDRMYLNYKDSIYDDVPAIHTKELMEFHQSSHGENSLQQDVDFNYWLYEENRSNRRYYCYRDNQVVAQQSAMEIELDINNKKIKAAYAIELWVRPEWKMKGMGVAMIGTLINQYDVLIGLGVSDEAYKMFLRQGWLDLGTLNLMVKPLSLVGLRKRQVKTGYIRKAEYIAALAASNLSNLYRRVFSQKGEFRKVSEFTEQHAKIANESYQHGSIKANRNVEYYNWRFIKFPKADAYDIYELVEGDVAVAFFVVKKSNWRGAEALLISEVHAEQRNLGKLIDKIVDLAIAKNASMIIYQGLDKQIQDCLKSRFFFNHPGGERLLVYTSKPELAPLLMNKKNWRICDADSDVDLFLENDFS